MKPSPIQLLQSTIEKLSVEANNEFHTENSGSIAAENLRIQVKEDFRLLESFWDDSNPVPAPGVETRTFSVTLGIRTDPDDRGTPYAFEIVCTGVVACIPDKVHELTPSEAARQYGLAMIYGAMREQFLTVTSRMAHGGRLLPTVSFMEPPAASRQLNLPLQASTTAAVSVQ